MCDGAIARDSSRKISSCGRSATIPKDGLELLRKPWVCEISQWKMMVDMENFTVVATA